MSQPLRKIQANPFAAYLGQHDLTLTRAPLQALQVNVGKLCNQACHHCHVDAGPKRSEIMTWETMARILDWSARHRIRETRYHRRRAGNQSPFPPLRGRLSCTGLPSHGPLQPHGAAGARTGRPAGLVRGARCTVGVLAALLHARKRRGTTRSRRVRQEHRRAQTPERRRLRTRSSKRWKSYG